MPHSNYQIPEHVKTVNPLSVSDRHHFFLGRLKHLPFSVQEVTLPSLMGQPVVRPTPFSDLFYPGSGIEWGPLTMSVLVDEYMLNYKEIYRWMMGIYIPNSFDQQSEYIEEERAKRGFANLTDINVSDGTLIILSSDRIPVLRFQFHDMFPTELGAITFTTTDSGVTHAKMNLTFRYTTFELIDIATPPSGA